MKKTSKKALSLVLVAMMLFALAACGNRGETPSTPVDTPTPEDTPVATPTPTPAPTDAPVAETQKIGISMPTQSIWRWYDEGNRLKDGLEAAGYEVDLQFGENEVPVQIAQIENMIAGGCDVLVIAAIDGDSLSNVLADAKANGIVVIAYLRLIMYTDAVDYYVTFDNRSAFVALGEAIESALDLKNAEGPFNIELFTGDPGDSNTIFFYRDSMYILQPYLDSGKLICLSGQTDPLSISTRGWSTENATARMEELISAQNYGPGKTTLHAVMCPSDSIAQGVTIALLAAGYTPGPDFPIITGMDCDIVSVRNIIAGTQYMSVLRCTHILTARVQTMVEQILRGEPVDINDTMTYYNGVRIVPAYLTELLIVTRENYRELLIDAGYYTEEELYDYEESFYEGRRTK